jgi:hypothetical protein
MGVSTDAILALGIPLDGDDPGFEPWEETDDDPPPGPTGMAVMGNEEDGVMLIGHCSNECTMYFVAVAGSEIRAWRGHPKDVTGKTESLSGEEKVRAFIEKHNLNPDGEFGWCLMSMWS